MAEILTTKALIALVTLTAMEIVLGIDNIIFIAILVGRAPEHKREMIRKVGIFLALIMRVALLLSISWVMKLTTPLFTIMEYTFSGRDLILLGGGLFLIAKSTFEIHHKVEGGHQIEQNAPPSISTSSLLFQIILLDIIFSLDSVITAVGMAEQIWVMIVAMVIAVAVMLAVSGAISGFVEKHPTIKILALSFLILIGVMLTAEGMGQHINKGYIYFAMAFSFLVELLNMRYRLKRLPGLE